MLRIKLIESTNLKGKDRKNTGKERKDTVERETAAGKHEEKRKEKGKKGKREKKRTRGKIEIGGILH